MKRLPCLFIGLLILALYAGLAQAQGARRFIDLSKIPAEGASLKDFVPSGWLIEKQVEGDLDKDTKADVVLELIEDKPDQVQGVSQARYRALLVLTRTEGGRLRLFAAGDRLLRCTTCFGLLTTSPRIEIIKGVIIVNHLYGSSDSVNYTLRFRYEPALKRMLLIGEDIKSSDRLTGASTLESTNYLTGQKTIESTQYNQKQERDILKSQSKMTVARVKKFLEQIDYENY